MLNISRFSSPSFSAKGSNSTSRRACWSSLAKSALFAGVAIGVIGAGRSQAFVVNVNGQDWDVTTFTGNYNANASKFALPPAPGLMPWWDSKSLASQFAALVGNGLGQQDTNSIIYPSNYGPFFGYTGPFSAPGFTGGTAISTIASNGPGTIGEVTVCGGDDCAFTWAQATPISSPAAPVPGPLPALGAAAAFGFSRKLRKRIKGSANAVSSSYSL